MITTTLFLRSKLRGKRSSRIHCFCSVVSKQQKNTHSTVTKEEKKRIYKGKKMYLGFLIFFEKQETKQRDERTLLSFHASTTTLLLL